MSSDEQEETPPNPSHFIGRREDIIQAKRVSKLVGGRDVLVIHHQGELYAIDARCYHTGGSLELGEIEEFNSHLCIVCPWHKYKITLAEGEGLYQAVDPSAKPLKPTWSSKGIKQRVHSVTETDGDVYVTLNNKPGAVDSDCYQTEKYRALLAKLETKKGK